MKRVSQWLWHQFGRFFRRPSKVPFAAPSTLYSFKSRSKIVEQLNRTLRASTDRRPELPPQRSSSDNASIKASDHSPHRTPLPPHNPIHIANEPYADHPDKIAALADIAYLCQQQGRLLEAETLYQRLIELSSQRFGKAHLSTAEGLNDLASLYRAQKRYAEAQPLLQQALSIQQQHLSADHPQLCKTLYHLVDSVCQQQQYPAVDALYQQALDTLLKGTSTQPTQKHAVCTHLMAMLVAAIESGQSDNSPNLK